METDYLISYGVLGEQGRVRAEGPLSCRRGERVVVETPRGVEIGVVLCPLGMRQVNWWASPPVGVLLRLPTDADLREEERAAARGQELFREALRRAEAMALPVLVLDAEAMLDGEKGVLHFVRWAEFDPRPLVSALSRHLGMTLSLADQTRSESGGCGDCGSGGCGSGCGPGKCGSAVGEEVRTYFAELRGKMQRADRIPLN